MRWKRKNPLDKRKWHRYFCLTPTAIDDTWVWLEWVERKSDGHFECPEYEYRKVTK
tara:strand:- start:1120 stop:1287 length:168 start_codon:yes stop_codon:yes gene_type:complete